MSSYKRFFRKCDRCKDLDCKYGHSTSQEAMTDSKKRGWIRVPTATGWEDRCPGCQERK